MTPEEIAELVLGEPVYDVCSVCYGTGKGDDGYAVITGTRGATQFKDTVQITLRCGFCVGRGECLNPGYLMALRKVDAPVPVCRKPLKYLPNILVSDTHVSIKIFDNRNQSVICPFSIQMLLPGGGGGHS